MEMTMKRVAINGILGRMGQVLTREIVRNGSGLSLVGGVDTLETYHADAIYVSTHPIDVVEECDVVVDFSSGDGVLAIVKACQTARKPLVTGTTGLSEDQQAAVLKLAETVPVVQATNFSVGINILIHLLRQTADVLQNRFDAQIVELFNRNMDDQPGNTAELLATNLANAMGLREGSDSGGDAIPIHSLRGGSVIGEHQIHLFCGNEHITLTHQALSRGAFAEGVVRAVHWVADRDPGHYRMVDVLGLRP